MSSRRQQAMYWLAGLFLPAAAAYSENVALPTTVITANTVMKMTMLIMEGRS